MRMMLIWVGLMFCFVFFLPFCGAKNFHPGLQRQKEAVCVCVLCLPFSYPPSQSRGDRLVKGSSSEGQTRS